MLMKTRYVIAAHPIQQAILDEVQGKGIDELSLRAIGERIGVKGSPQQVKHHLSQMVKYGFLDIVGGKYRIGIVLKRQRPFKMKPPRRCPHDGLEQCDEECERYCQSKSHRT